jgi:hypothetical protein
MSCGWVYPYNVAEVELQADRVRIRLAEGSGMIYDDAATRLKLTAFPQREHVGPVRIDGAAAHRISSSPDVILPRPHESPESTGPIGHPLS